MAEAEFVPQAGHDPHYLSLEASRNRTTGLGIFPRIPDHSPARGDFEPITLSPLGRLYSFTIIHPNPKTGKPPFVLAYVDFPEQVRVFGRLDLAADRRPAIGMTVAAEAWEESYRFVAAEEKAA